MAGYPRWVDDPGTYLSQAWSFQYERALSPYSYFYDHAPAGWMQLGLWSMLTDGFGRHATAIGFGNECMLIAKVVSAGLLYVLGRRLGISRPGAAAVVLLFGLCPLELVYSRWTFLDNLVTPWLLLAFVLAYSPRRSIAAATGAAMSFAMAALTKETALILLPAFVWAVAQNLDRRNRSQVIAVAAFCGCLLMALYPLYALYKGELLPAPDRNSLLGTAQWQLLQRQSSGSLLDPHSGTAATFAGWLRFDRILLLSGAGRDPVRVLRPAAAAGRARPGHRLARAAARRLPAVHARADAAAVERAARRRCAGAGGRQRAAVRPAPARSPAGGPAGPGPSCALSWSMVAAVALGATVASWAPSLRQMTSVTAEPPLRSAERWVADNVPRNKVLVVHDAIWTDLVQKYGYQPRPIIVYKLDTDPAVRASLHRIDYLVLPNWYYQTPDGESKYPTVMEARKHAVPVAQLRPRRRRRDHLPGQRPVAAAMRRPDRPRRGARRAGRGLLGCAQQPDRTLHPDPPAVTYRPLTHPFQGATLAVDPDSEAARYERAHGAGWLAPIAEQPQARWINSPQDLDTLPALLARRPGPARAAGPGGLLGAEPRLLEAQAGSPDAGGVPGLDPLDDRPARLHPGRRHPRTRRRARRLLRRGPGPGPGAGRAAAVRRRPVRLHRRRARPLEVDRRDRRAAARVRHRRRGRLRRQRVQPADHRRQHRLGPGAVRPRRQAAVRGRRVPQRDRPAAGRAGRRPPSGATRRTRPSAWPRPRTRARRASTPCSGSSDRGSPTASAAARSPTSSRPARPGSSSSTAPTCGRPRAAPPSRPPPHRRPRRRWGERRPTGRDMAGHVPIRGRRDAGSGAGGGSADRDGYE